MVCSFIPWWAQRINLVNEDDARLVFPSQVEQILDKLLGLSEPLWNKVGAGYREERGVVGFSGYRLGQEGFACGNAISSVMLSLGEQKWSKTNCSFLKVTDTLKICHFFCHINKPQHHRQEFEIDVPVPGGPKRRIPLHGLRLPVNRWGNLMGRMTASLSDSLARSKPATSDHLMLGFSMTMASCSFVIIFFFSGSSLLSESLSPSLSPALPVSFFEPPELLPVNMSKWWKLRK